MVLTAVWTAASNRNSSTVFSYYCERKEVKDGIHAWYLHQRHAIDNLSDDEMLEMVCLGYSRHFMMLSTY